ncbi:MAG: hypothetical protein RLZ55_1184, partial [Actinomycetota bacterium]
MIIWNAVAPAFFRGETLSKRSSSDLILEVPGEDDTLRLPDSGLQDLVIAPDLSNLPEGSVALDLESSTEVSTTGELRALDKEKAEHPEKFPPTEHPHHGPPAKHPLKSDDDGTDGAGGASGS